MFTDIHNVETTPFCDFTTKKPNELVSTANYTSILTSSLLSPDECNLILKNTIDELWVDQINSKEILHKSKSQKLLSIKEDFPSVVIKESITIANNQVFKFILEGISAHDYPQIFKYSKNNFFNLHSDLNTSFTSRKLTFIINLSDEREYDGGKLQFLNYDDNIEFNKIGSIVVFPSFIPYKITPVKKGVKCIIVGHIHGPNFV
jgi:predicted 2-oxoglutarate/Fe(II)-dependent dioxygenase YbiX